MPTTALIADDEQNLTDYLKTRLAVLWPELEIVAEARNGKEALEMARRLKPDVLFLDIKMPVMSGIEVASVLGNEFRVVFVTAYDEYAVKAFEEQAVDYLLKPVDDDRLTKTIERIKKAGPEQIDIEKLTSLLKPAQEYLSWVRVGLRDETKIIPVTDVAYFKADQKYVSVRTTEGEFLIRKSIKELEVELDPNVFWRIHRSTLVNAHFVESAKKDFRGRFTIHLKGLRQTLKVSDSYGYRFRQM